jgi:uncharacterized membrane protein
MDFAEVEREVAKLRQDLAAGRLTEDECKARMRELMVQDEEGNWWMVGYETGQWHRHDGTEWVPDQPPARTLPARRSVFRLNFYLELGLALLGAALFGLGNGVVIEINKDFPFLLFVFVPSLLGILFGPWPGSFAGVLGGRVLGELLVNQSAAYGDPWAFALCGFALGVLPGLMVKDAQDWKATLRIAAVMGVICALVAATAGSLAGYVSFWENFGLWAVAVLPINVLLMPLLARWLVGPVRRWGLYWRDRS